jgi:hypothetical protein
MSRHSHPDPQSDTDEADLTELDFATMEANLAAMEDHLFNAGVAILQSAKTQEEVFQTSIEAIQEALEPGHVDAVSPDPGLPISMAPSEISLVTVWQRLDRIEQRLEYLIHHLIPADPASPIAPPATAQQSSNSALVSAAEWTEKSLKKAYKTLAVARSQLGIQAKNWKLAVAEANALRQANLP